MKPLFAIDITNDKKNEAVNGEEFITKTASENIADSLEENQDELQDTIKKSQPRWLMITKFVFLMYALIVASGILRADIDFKLLGLRFADAYSASAAKIGNDRLVKLVARRAYRG